MIGDLYVSGIGAVGAFGSGKEALKKALSEPEDYHSLRTVALEDGEIPLPVYEADLSSLEDYFPKRTLRRINRFGKMVGLAANDALVDAGVEKTIDRSRLGLVLATGYGSSASTFDFLDSYYMDENGGVSPMTFSYSVHASAMSTATILLGITGPALTINQLETSTALALQTARGWLATERADAVLVGGCDEYCDILGYTYAKLFGPTKNGQTDIHNTSEQSAVPGEGAAFMLLSRAPSLTDYARLMGDSSERANVDLRILGFDGHRTHGNSYEPFVSDESVRAVSLANLTGSFPTRSMIDLTAAALALGDRVHPHETFRMNNAAVAEDQSCIEVVVDDGQQPSPSKIRLVSADQTKVQ